MAHVPMKRSLSIKSEETLNKLGSFEKQLVEMETRFATYSALLDRYNSTGRWASSDPDLAIVSVKTALETMVGKLDALQFQKLDSIQTVELHSGKCSSPLSYTALVLSLVGAGKEAAK